jgi:hypothetical protein
MADNGEILNAHIKFETDKGSLRGEIDHVVGDLEKVTPHATRAENSMKSFFKTLREQGGRSSNLGQTLKILQGGGAVIGVTMIGVALDEAVEKTSELVKQFQLGKITAVGMAQGFLESLPIIGGFAKAGHAIYDFLLPAEKEAKDLLQKQLELEEKLLAIRQQSSKAIIGFIESQHHVKEALEDQGKILNEHSGTYGLEVAKEDARYNAQRREQEGPYMEMRRDATEEAQKKNAAIEETYKDSTAHLRDLVGETEYTDEQAEAMGYHDFTKRRQAAEGQKQIEKTNVNDRLKQRLGDINDAEQPVLDALKANHDVIMTSLLNAAEEVRKITNHAEVIGKNDLDAFETEIKQAGLPNEAIGPLMAAKVKELSAKVHEELLDPLEKYDKEVGYYEELNNKGGLSKSDLYRGQQKAAQQLYGSIQPKSGEDMFMENIRNRTINSVLNGKDQNSGGFDGKDDNTKAVKDNTLTGQKLTDTMRDLGKALTNARNQAKFGA